MNGPVPRLLIGLLLVASSCSGDADGPASTESAEPAQAYQCAFADVGMDTAWRLLSDAAGSPIVVYENPNDPGQVAIARCEAGVTEAAGIVDLPDGGFFLGARLDPAGNPLVMFDAAERFGIVACEDPSCRTAMSWFGDAAWLGPGLPLGMAVADDGDLIVFDGPPLGFARCAPAGCETLGYLDHSPRGLGWPALVHLLPGGEPMAFYTDGAGGHYVARCVDPACSAWTAEFLLDLPASTTVPGLRLPRYAFARTNLERNVAEIWVASCLDDRCGEMERTLLEAPGIWEDWRQDPIVFTGDDGNPVIVVAGFQAGEGRVDVFVCDGASCASGAMREIGPVLGSEFVATKAPGEPLLIGRIVGGAVDEGGEPMGGGVLVVDVCPDPATCGTG